MINRISGFEIIFPGRISKVAFEVLQLIKRSSFRADDYLAITLYVLKSEVIGISSPFSFAMRMSSNPRL
jgi:hypothetical protein